MPIIQDDEVIFNGPVTFNQTPKVLRNKLFGGFPTVTNQSLFLSHDAASIITDFQGGAEGQVLTILGNGNTTITHGTNIFTNTGADKVLAADLVYRFTFINGKWYEDG